MTQLLALGLELRGQKWYDWNGDKKKAELAIDFEAWFTSPEGAPEWLPETF